MTSQKLPPEYQARMSRALKAALAELGDEARGLTLTVLWEGDRSTCSAAVSEREPDQHAVMVSVLARAPAILMRWFQYIAGTYRPRQEASVVRS